jgi:cyclin H
MDYHPRQIMPAALFLATKTENFHTPLKTFAEKLKQVPGLTKLTAENVLAPEFILTQGLRFCFDVRHPYRALKGFYLECTILMQIAKGQGPPADWTNRDSVEIQHNLLQKGTPAKFLKSIDEGYGRAKDILNSAALLSDAYFLYTPSQILFAAWYTQNPSLIEYYIDMKLSINPTAPPKHKVMATIRECAALLAQSEVQTKEDKMALVQIDKKLFKCQNPDKTDLIGLNKAHKRDAGEDGKLDEGVAKKRKLEREKNEKDAEDLFGPGLVQPEVKG